MILVINMQFLCYNFFLLLPTVCFYNPDPAKPETQKVIYPVLTSLCCDALVASAIVIFLMNEVDNPFANPNILTNYYIISGSAAIIFWLFDSIILQGEIVIK